MIMLYWPDYIYLYEKPDYITLNEMKNSDDYPRKLLLLKNSSLFNSFASNIT